MSEHNFVSSEVGTTSTAMFPPIPDNLTTMDDLVPLLKPSTWPDISDEAGLLKVYAELGKVLHNLFRSEIDELASEDTCVPVHIIIECWGCMKHFLVEYRDNPRKARKRMNNFLIRCRKRAGENWSIGHDKVMATLTDLSGIYVNGQLAKQEGWSPLSTSAPIILMSATASAHLVPHGYQELLDLEEEEAEKADEYETLG